MMQLSKIYLMVSMVSKINSTLMNYNITMLKAIQHNEYLLTSNSSALLLTVSYILNAGQDYFLSVVFLHLLK